MMLSYSFKCPDQKRAALSARLGVLLAFLFFQPQGLAAPVANVSSSTQVGALALPAPPPSGCAPFGATYMGTELPAQNTNAPFHDTRTNTNQNIPSGFPAGLPAPPASNLPASGADRPSGAYPDTWRSAYNPQLDWTSAGSNSTNYIRTFTVPCTGTYQIFFYVTIQSDNQGTNPINIIPTVTASNPTQTIFPTATTPNTSFNFYPACMVSTANPQPFNGGYYCSVVTFYFSVQANLTQNQIVNPPQIGSSPFISVVGGEFRAFYLHN